MKWGNGHMYILFRELRIPSDIYIYVFIFDFEREITSYVRIIPAVNYLPKIGNVSTRTMGQVCSKLIKKTPKRRQ